MLHYSMLCYMISYHEGFRAGDPRNLSGVAAPDSTRRSYPVVQIIMRCVVGVPVCVRVCMHVCMHP